MKLFSWFNKPQRDLEQSIDELRATFEAQRKAYDELSARNTFLQQRVDYLTNLEKDLQSRQTSIQSYAIDFKLLNAFSVECQFDDKGNPFTTVGWLDKDGHPQEWHLYCNQDAHEELVKQFIASKAP